MGDKDWNDAYSEDMHKSAVAMSRCMDENSKLRARIAELETILSGRTFFHSDEAVEEELAKANKRVAELEKDKERLEEKVALANMAFNATEGLIREINAIPSDAILASVRVAIEPRIFQVDAAIDAAKGEQ